MCTVSATTTLFPASDTVPVTAHGALVVPDSKPLVPALHTTAYDSHLTTRDRKETFVTLDIYKPYRNAKGAFVARSAMQGEIFRVLHSLDKGTPVSLTVTHKGIRVTGKVQKHMSTPTPSGRVYGEIAFTFTLPNGQSISRDVPVYEIVAIACNVKGKGKEYTY